MAANGGRIDFMFLGTHPYPTAGSATDSERDEDIFFFIDAMLIHQALNRFIESMQTNKLYLQKQIKAVKSNTATVTHAW